MIVCPNCNHQNPDGATQCEACYTPLPAMTSCPNCGATVQADAAFCGQCGFNLKAANAAPAAPSAIPDLLPPDPLVPPEPLPVPPVPATVVNLPPDPVVANIPPDPIPVAVPDPIPVVSIPPDPIPVPPLPDPIPVRSDDSVALDPTSIAPPDPIPAASGGVAKTQLQVQSARLLHVQTKTTIELPPSLSVIHIGKTNDQIPPDIDVSGFPNSEIVSRVHADIRVEGDAYFVEDVGSSNGTYINHNPLPQGNRHRLRAGDRISLGKGDLMTFLFQIS